MKYYVHPTSQIDENVIIEDGVFIGPYCVISKNVKIMRNAYITHCIMGENNIIYPNVVIGTEPQDKNFKNEHTLVKIGNNNIIRELTCIQRATGENNITYIGDNNFIMSQVHIGHNCYIGNNTIISTLVGVAGYTFVDDFVILGGMSGIHQKVRIGKYTIIGGLTKVSQDIPPFMMVDGNPPRVVGINREGMKRNGFSSKQIDLARKIYKIIYTKKMSIRNVVKTIEDLRNSYVDEDDLFIIDTFLDFLKGYSIRGIKK
ncbi:MAG: acyl-ACP--UDP-N-acetylglucosamine O-acyltransferase [Candidatus Calescibacterium sp.]|nr:acyl-ACP--UDP-N-acetylglucosamine O-acyltransferase [Candidatus Calescibacterium sp.]MCX7972134.1 acyl-ACP--UDP-N-acetylglucosamine O-acyltransferase [bacterium]MDW8194822.1 acyl-ACP--UDP-N-acetylglucosamine O-acyltransferase [Candidatus Calescibacterium sp.]